MLRLPRIVFACLFVVATAQAQDLGVTARAQDLGVTAQAQDLGVTAVRTAQNPVIDGRLDEAVWSLAPVVSGLVQRVPDEGRPATQRTEIRVLYDDAALYVGARMFDLAPDSIVARLGRRDAAENSDGFTIFIDPYLDRRSGFFFGVTAAGTILDGVLLNDYSTDVSWDGIWEGRVNVDAEGWSAEMRIPYSQLRFRDQAEHRWGVNFRRIVARHNEEAYLVHRPLGDHRFVSRFAPMTGITGITPPRRLEVAPYMRTRAAYLDARPGDPFNGGGQYVPVAGMDVKVGLGSNLTVDATVNPDFGQVEVDPAVVNLSDVETFFEEKRPFFLEGASIFDFGRGGARMFWQLGWSTPQLFYSRRIGRAPRGSLPSHDFVKAPDGTRILGAAKLTGRLPGGVSVGSIHAATARETAVLQSGGDRFDAEVEPLAYAGVLRAAKEFDEGAQGIGILSTLNTRRFDDLRLRAELPHRSTVQAVDGWAFLDSEKTWVLNGWAAVSHVTGSPAFITDLQQSATHYHQRPDARHVRVKPSATSLSGTAARFHLNKERGSTYANLAVGLISPGFNANDLGYLSHADVLNAHAGFGKMWQTPRGLRRMAEVGGVVFGSRDFDGNRTGGGIRSWWYVESTSFYWVHLLSEYNSPSVNNRRTRGGPLTLNSPSLDISLQASSDNRKPVSGQARLSTYRSDQSWRASYSFGLRWRPASNIALSLEPQVSILKTDLQWVEAFDDAAAAATFGRRYMFGHLDQTTISAAVRLDWTFTPQLSLQLYAQPLISAGDYSNFKELLHPKSNDYREYADREVRYDDGGYTIDVGGPYQTLSFGDPSFNLMSLRGNAVLRWEYRPGSTLYLVWTQRRWDDRDDGDLRLASTFDRVVDARADNIFMVKLNYWFSL